LVPKILIEKSQPSHVLPCPSPSQVQSPLHLSKHFLSTESPTLVHTLLKYRVFYTCPHTSQVQSPLHLSTHFSSKESPALVHTLVIHTQVSHWKAELLHTLAMAPLKLPPRRLLVFLGEGDRRRWRWSSCSRSSGSRRSRSRSSWSMSSCSIISSSRSSVICSSPYWTAGGGGDLNGVP